MRIELRDLSYAYPRPRSGERAGPVLSGVNLAVEEGEFFTLLGPSGCGKTTLLWLLAGFLHPTGGEILLDGQRANDLPPEKRSAGVVFQNYALFPNMSVFENVAFGLRSKPRASRPSRAEIEEKVGRALRLVSLEGYEKRRPAELSGGQQQRVALARAAAFEPRFLLMDEPLSNLDAALRVETRQRVRALQRELRATTIYVTHDQEEALAQSDRLGLMEGGRLLQVGSPEDLYQRPESRFAASFLGRCNLFDATLVEGGRAVRVEGIGEFAAPPRSAYLASDATNALLLVRPEHFHVVCPKDEAAGLPRVSGRLEGEEYLGEKRLLRLASPSLPGGLVEVALRGRDANRCPAPVGGEASFAFDPAECWLLPA